MKMCPKCGSKSFITTAHVVQEWEVDYDGEFVETTDDCVTVSHYPDDSDIWQCSLCGHESSGKEFNGIKLYETSYNDGKLGFAFLTPDDLYYVKKDLAGELNRQNTITLVTGEVIETGIIDSVVECTNEIFSVLCADNPTQEFVYQLLDRCLQDCKYFLGEGNRQEKNLWGKTALEHVRAMRVFYDYLEVKPEWLTLEEIKKLAAEMFN